MHVVLMRVSFPSGDELVRAEGAPEHGRQGWREHREERNGQRRLRREREKNTENRQGREWIRSRQEAGRRGEGKRVFDVENGSNREQVAEKMEGVMGRRER